MVQGKILEYAKKHIELTASENEIQQVNLFKDSLSIEMRTGKSYELSQKEIMYQAKEHLLSELQDLTEN